MDKQCTLGPDCDCNNCREYDGRELKELTLEEIGYNEKRELEYLERQQDEHFAEKAERAKEESKYL